MPTTPRQTVEMQFTIDGDNLILTIDPESLHVCRHCPNLHVLILKDVTLEKMKQLVIGIAHLASHLPDE